MKKWVVILISSIIAILYFIITLFTRVIQLSIDYFLNIGKASLFIEILSLPYYIPVKLFVYFNFHEGNWEIITAILSIVIYFIQFIIVGLILNYIINKIRSDDESSRKKGIILLLVIILSIVLISLIIFYINFSNDNKCKKEMNHDILNTLKPVKCLSLCPFNIVKSDNNQENRFAIDGSCQYYCQKKYINNTSTSNQCLKNKKYNEIYNSFNEDLQPCLKYWTKDPNNFKSCINEVANKYSYIEDLSDMKLESYTIYNLTIDNLDCNKSPPEVTVKLNQGIDNLLLVIYTNSIQNIKSEAPKVGETRTYTINESIYKNSYYPNNLSDVKVTLMVDNYTLTSLDSKSC